MAVIKIFVLLSRPAPLISAIKRLKLTKLMIASLYFRLSTHLMLWQIIFLVKTTAVAVIHQFCQGILKTQKIAPVMITALFFPIADSY